MVDMAKSAKDHAIPGDFAAAAALLRSLITSRRLLKDTLETPAVAAALDLASNGVAAGNDQERLEAVSILGKAAEFSKPVAAIVQPILKARLLSALPHIGAWGTADDRYYLAKGVAGSDAQWIRSYAAIELARADIAEKKSREIWADLAISRADSLAEALRTIGSALAEDRKAAGYSVDTACRKVNRISKALGDRISLADVPAGEGFGKAFSDLAAQAGGMNGPKTRPLRQETALTVLNLMVQILRLRFAAALDSDVYRAAGMVLSWWKPARPPDAVDARANRIVQLAMDALQTLARQGVSQKTLRQALVTAFGAQIVNSTGARIVANDPSLQPDTASWLASGRALPEVRTNIAVREINEQALDETVARLLLAIDNEEGGPQALEMVAGAVELLEPEHAATVRTAATRARLVAQTGKAIAARRRLSLSGERGELVSYDPALHDANDDLQISARARIRMPGVIKEMEGRPATVIVKAQVEKP